jgi:protein CpxP
MSLKNKLSSIFTVALAVVAFAAFSFAQDSKATTPAPEKDKADRHWKGDGKHSGHGEGFGHGGGMMRMFHDLNLTEAQKTQIHSIMDANKPDQATREEMHTLFEAKHNGTLTADQQARFDTLREQQKAKMKSIHEQIMNVLTPEQKAQLQQKMTEMKQNREQRQQRRQQTPAATTETTKEN